MYKPTLCLDFDGVIHSYVSGWAGADKVLDPPVKGAMDFLRRAVEEFDVCIYSSRSHQKGGMAAMKNWMEGHLVQDHGSVVGMHIFLRLAWPLEKPSAKVTIDDRALTFMGTWPPLERLKSFRPWNEHMKRPKSAA